MKADELEIFGVWALTSGSPFHWGEDAFWMSRQNLDGLHPKKSLAPKVKEGSASIAPSCETFR